MLTNSDKRRPLTQTTLTRRSALLALGTAGLLLAGIRPRIARALPGGDRALLDAAGSLLRDRRAASEVGRAYLAAYPNIGRHDILQTLTQAIPPLPHAASGRDDLKVRLDLAVRRDFSVGRTVQVNGWILSRTEASLCALTSFS